jgi:PAS domain-containing protein
MITTVHSFGKGRQTQDVHFVVDVIPTLAWSARPDGSADFFNQRWLDYTGLSAEQARDWGWMDALHPDDLKQLTNTEPVIIYTLAGATQRSDTDPYDTTSPPIPIGSDWMAV